MSVSLTKAYSKSHLIIAVEDKGNLGNLLVKTVRISGHPMRVSTQKRAIKVLVETIARGHKVISAVINLITEDLSEQSCKIFQPQELCALKVSDAVAVTQHQIGI